MSVSGKTIDASPCAATAIRKASRRLSQLYDEALQSSGLKSTQFSILATLNTYGPDAPPTMIVLAKALVLDRTALRHNLRLLERDKLVTVMEDETDGRKRRVALTSLGKARLREASPLWRTAQDRFFDVVGKRSGEDLRAHLLEIAHDERLGRLAD